MFNPIVASANIKDEYIGYITTSFNIADKEYARQFENELQKEGAVTKGPYLDISDSFRTGKSLEQLIEDNAVSSLFRELEASKSDANKELQLKRALYLHQQQSIEKINDNRNLVVTTGTGSGKTECFIIPIINHLLREKEKGKLGPGVRAILVYPMNALANDQMKRLRELLSEYEDITFGVYNGSTQQDDESGINEYGRIYKDANGAPLKPLNNEVISRETMQKKPPHILVTNYAMLEYMLLRPNDDLVFSGANLRFIVLDEAHIYRGTTGMETSLLIRRLKARISDPDNVLHIITSATLGGKEADEDIARFASTLCGATFRTEDIVRSVMEAPEYKEEAEDIPAELFAEMANPIEPLNTILSRFGRSKQAGISDEEYIFDLCLNSTLYRAIRSVIEGPMTVKEIADAVNDVMPVTEQDIVNLISVAVQGEKNKTVLMKARYHMFAKALEGAYVTINKNKILSLTRKNHYLIDSTQWKGFECAVCDDCGRLGITGQLTKNDILEFVSNAYGEKSEASYFMIAEDDETDFLDDEDLDDEEIGKNNYLICSKCGSVIHESLKKHITCEHTLNDYVRVRKADVKGKNETPKCPCCNTGSFRRFYMGYDASTAVLGTSLYEQLPETEIILKSSFEDINGKKNLFGKSATKKQDVIKKSRQFLSFSDSRGEAAFFACYMEDSYQEFLRRRGIWHIVEQNRQSMSANPWEISDFVDALTAFFEQNRTFASAGDKGTENLSGISRKMAWIAVLNEMVNARRATSLSSLGIISFQYKGNTEEVMEDVAEEFNQDVNDVKALFDLLVMDIVYHGAIKGDCNLSEDEAEYIYYTSIPKRVKKLRDEVKDKGYSSVMGWIPNIQTNGNTRKNGRIVRCMNVLEIDQKAAAELLDMYWEGILNGEFALIPEGDGKFCFKTDCFRISAGADTIPVYECAKCGRITSMNCKDMCSSVKCTGKLRPISRSALIEGNHYARLYSSDKTTPLHIKEHTAQLGRAEQQRYQEMFINKELNALSCSTTFEMGVDVGDLETVYLRDVPPTPANYVQRAGRAGRSKKSAAFALTYAKLASHDFTYYNNPTKMISGKIGVPLFAVKNEKVILRHIFAVALSSFFSQYENVYNKNNADVFLNENGYELLKNYLADKPENLRQLLIESIPTDMHEEMGIMDFGWVDRLIGETGVLEIAVNGFKTNVEWYEAEINRLAAANDFAGAGRRQNELRKYRRSKADNAESHVGNNELIEFLVRNNVLPKYGFPVDTVELHQGQFSTQNSELQMVRDLQLAIGEYAPAAQVVADGKLFTSRYIRKLPRGTGHEWEVSYIAECPNPSCKTWNYSITDPSENGLKCISCQTPITKWGRAIEPRQGFTAEPNWKPVPMRKPKKSYRSDDYYIGDVNRQYMSRYIFTLDNGNSFKMETSINDSLMVKCNDDFFVCETCGYSESQTENRGKTDEYRRFIDRSHNAPWGKECKHKLRRHMLCHVFKTDVVSLTFFSRFASDEATMLSVMYALLEAMSRALDIERNDIKGCLHKVRHDGKLIYSIVLYDAVAGGAGHVRRLAQEDCDNFQKVIKTALDITRSCNCDPSCYNCLRNYYNQKIHDLLDRNMARDFLYEFDGSISNVNASEDNMKENDISFVAESVKHTINLLGKGKSMKSKSSTDIWNEVLQDCSENEKPVIEDIITADIKDIVKPILGEMVTYSDNTIDDSFEVNLIWPEKKVMLFLDGYEEEYQAGKMSDYRCFSTTDNFDAGEFLDSIKK